MAIKPNIHDKLQIDTVQIRLTSSLESILASLEPYARWIEQMLDAPLSETLTLDVIEAIELQTAGAYDLKTSVSASGFVRHPEHSTSRK